MRVSRLLYISDLDGTLLLPDKTLGARTRQVLQRLLAAGGLFTVATGRSAASAANILRGLDLPLDAIVHNGAQVVNLTSGVVSRQTGMPGPLVERLMAQAVDRGLAPLAYVERQGVVTLVHGPLTNQPSRRYAEAMVPLLRVAPFCAGQWLQHHGLSMILLDEPSRLRDYFAACCQPAVGVGTSLGPSAYLPQLGVGEVQAAAATKASAARHLAHSVGLSPEQIVAFGDNHNDLPLLALAGQARCVDDAPAEVLRQCPLRVAPAAQQGVAAYLERALQREH